MKQAYRDELKGKKRKKFVHKLLAVFLIAVSLTAGVIYLLFFAKLLDIRTVEISGTENLDPSDLKSAVNNWLEVRPLGISRKNNVLFFSTVGLAAEITSKFARLDSIVINRRLPHDLEISVGERKPAGIWCLPKASVCFYFDKNAIAYDQTSGSSGFLLTTIYDYRDRNVALGSIVVPENWFRNIILAKELLPKAGINLAEFAISAGSFDEFEAKTVEGWKIKFSNSTNIEEQISALASLLKEKIKPEQRTKLQYVDLRIQDRIYYK